MTEPNPYRLPIIKPVCARCKHRADANAMDDHEPWRDWFCLAVEKFVEAGTAEATAPAPAPDPVAEVGKVIVSAIKEAA